MSESDKMYFPVPKIGKQDLLDWENTDERNYCHWVRLSDKKGPDLISKHGNDDNGGYMYRKCFGNKVLINDEEIALFRTGDTVHAIQAKCPHAGGPLHLADIEELVPTQTVVRCPWHKWTFDIMSGQCVSPKDREVMAKTYPVRVDNRGRIFVGFDSFGPSAFAEMDF